MEKHIVKIQNNNREIIITFTTKKEIDLMIKAINNCIKYPLEHPTIDYSDKEDNIIFTYEYLKNSLIIIPKVLK